MASISGKSPRFKIVLGSSSPARREILADMGYEFTVMSADIDERAIRREEPEQLVKALAERSNVFLDLQAEAIKQKLQGDSAPDSDQPALLITSDQVMVSKGMIRERPRSAQEAREFIKGYSDDRAFAVNFVLVTNLSTGATKGGWDIPEIKFQHIPDEFIDRVVKPRHPTNVVLLLVVLGTAIYTGNSLFRLIRATGDMTCVAGGLKLTHPSVQPFIKELVGTVDSVRGLPRELTEKLIRESLQEE